MDESIRNRVPTQWEDAIENLRKQLPPAPEGVLSAYVRWIPWLAIIFGIIGLFWLLVAGVFLTVLSPFLMLAGASGVKAGASALFAVLFGIAIAALSVAGGVLMRRRSLTGWWILAAAYVVQAVSSVFSLAIFGLVIVAIVAYLHVQVRPRYS